MIITELFKKIRHKLTRIIRLCGGHRTPHIHTMNSNESTSMHGVFMEVLGFGLFIKGKVAIGKSELALALISRGHRLIADDVVDFYHTSPTRIEGCCPELLQDLLEVRGLGVLDIRAMYGNKAVKTKKLLDLIIKLELADVANPQILDRLSSDIKYERILNVDIRNIVIPIAAGRNIAVLVEAAVRNHMLLLNGIHTTQVFVERQKKLIDNESKPS